MKPFDIVDDCLGFLDSLDRGVYVNDAGLEGLSREG